MRPGALALIATLFVGVVFPTPLSSQSPAPSSTIPGAKSELRVGYASWVGYGPIFLAREKQYFAEAGVNVVLVEIPDPRQRFADLAAGRLDGLVTTVDTMSQYWRPAFQFKAVLGLADSDGNDGIVTTNSIRSIADLRGKTVAYNTGSVSHFFLSALLRENGMSENDIRSVTAFSNGRQVHSDEAGAMVLAHKVDAAATWEPWLTRAKSTPGTHVLVDSSSTPGLIMDVLLFRQETIDQHPDAVGAVINSWQRAVEYWKQNPDESNALMAKALDDWLKDVKVFKEVLAGVRFYDRAINEQYFAPYGQIFVTTQKALEIWTALGIVHPTGTVTDIIDPDFVRR